MNLNYFLWDSSQGWGELSFVFTLMYNKADKKLLE